MVNLNKLRCLGKLIGPVKENAYPPRCGNSRVNEKHCTIHAKG